MTQPLDPEFLAQILKEDAEKPKGRGSGHARVDVTETRTIAVWFKLNHHICSPDCAHRKENPAGPDKACWNINCVDPRESTDRANMIVAYVKKEWICRYCFLDGYLK